jgi:PIN domain nuclease of toxin-antitoxin system
MNYLLDTHTFIWWALEPKKLSKRILQLLEAPSNNVFLSIVSIWEMHIKMHSLRLVNPQRL